MEPERRIEKLLRAFAKKRREQAGEPMELRPAARQRLQNEISRRAAAGKSVGGFWENFLARFRPRIALALMTVAIVAVGAFLLVPGIKRDKEMTLSANKAQPSETPAPPMPALSAPLSTAAPAVAPPAPAAPSAAPVVAAAKDYDVSKHGVTAEGRAMKPGGAAANSKTLSDETDKTKQDKIPQAMTAPPETVVASTPSAGQRSAEENVLRASNAGANTGAVARDSFGRLDQKETPSNATNTLNFGGATIVANSDVATRRAKAETAAGETSAAASAEFGRIQNFTPAPVISQAFNRLDAPVRRLQAAGTAGASAPLLVTFRVEQQGDQMRVVDADGSVYTGAVQWAQQAPAQNSVLNSPKNAAFANQVAKNVQQLETAQNYYFRVAGTNRNLNQHVVFSGNLIPLTNALAGQFKADGFGGGGGGGAVQNNNQQQQPMQELLSNSRISGTAVIDGQKKIEVDATPTLTR